MLDVLDQWVQTRETDEKTRLKAESDFYGFEGLDPLIQTGHVVLPN